MPPTTQRPGTSCPTSCRRPRAAAPGRCRRRARCRRRGGRRRGCGARPGAGALLGAWRGSLPRLHRSGSRCETPSEGRQLTASPGAYTACSPAVTREHIVCCRPDTRKLQLPRLAHQIVPEAVVLLLLHELEPHPLVDPSRRVQDVVGPQRHPAVPGFPGESQALVHQLGPYAVPSRPRFDEQQPQPSDLIRLLHQEDRPRRLPPSSAIQQRSTRRSCSAANWPTIPATSASNSESQPYSAEYSSPWRFTTQPSSPGRGPRTIGSLPGDGRPPPCPAVARRPASPRPTPYARPGSVVPTSPPLPPRNGRPARRTCAGPARSAPAPAAGGRPRGPAR